MSYLRLIKWGALAAVVVAAGLYVWTAERAKERLAYTEAQLEVAQETAAHNAEQARRLKEEIDATEALLSRAREERDRIERDTSAELSRLRAILQDAPDEVQDCMPVRLPDAVLDSVYGTPEGDPEG